MSVNAAANWLQCWRMTVNSTKTVVMETSRRSLPYQFSITLNSDPLAKVKQHKHLGLTFTDDLRWTSHVNNVLGKTAPLLGLLRRLRSSLSREALITIYTIYIRPKLEYASIAWCNLPGHLVDRLERLQRRAAKIILGLPLFRPSNHQALLQEIGWPTLHSRRRLQLAILAYKIATGTAPTHLNASAFPVREHAYSTRNTDHFQTPIARTHVYQNSPLFLSASVFNELSPETRTSKSLALFKQNASAELLSYRCSCSRHI